MKALTEGFNTPVRDTLWGHIYMPSTFEPILRSAPFMRLHRIFQLGPTFYVYPGATHTRAAHSIGVYHLSRRLLTMLADRGADTWLSDCGVRSFLCAALLHDVGHFPYTHSLKELPLRSHESLTASLIKREPLNRLVAATGADPDITAAIVDSEVPYYDNTEILFYRLLLSGTLDPDKLDYLNRDAWYCGVPYGKQDVDFIFSQLYPDKKKGIILDARGLSSIESLLFSKYLMYKTVYWHRSVRSATAMIKKALIHGLTQHTISAETLYDRDDQELFSLLALYPDALFELGKKVRDGYHYLTAMEFPFDSTIHTALNDPQKRTTGESLIAAALSIAPSSLIIDNPGPLSFETELAFKGIQTTGVFSTDTVRTFEKSLYTVRVFVDPSCTAAFSPEGREIITHTLHCCTD
ncbi:MAG: HD domain-containing protein [Treponema sp.]|jgi:HD superfamily phosphohydrolase|nr:HD domain-containing protein [Treponema sp.]